MGAVRLRGRQRDVVNELLARGWQVERFTGSGHVKVVHPPTGRHVIVAMTTGDRRSWRNLRAEVRRIEARILDGHA